MTQPNRLASGGRIDRSRTLRFEFDGRTYPGYAGDTLASALLANGVSVVARSFKYGRPRGILAAGAEEPNALVEVGASEATHTPNVRATQQALYDGLVSRRTSGWPSLGFDALGLVGGLLGRLLPAGFYYKTFMAPRRAWPLYEKYLRKAAGFGRSPTEADADAYDHLNHWTDVLVVGAGPAGLAAALATARAGARVVLADEQEEAGGSLLHERLELDGEAADRWVARVLAELADHPEVTWLSRTTVNGYHDHNFLTLHQRLTDHQGDRAPAGQPRQRLHRVRARRVVLASGAHERPLVFAGNDRPGCLLASAVSIYIRRYAVRPGQRLVLMTTNDAGYQAAFDWQDAGGTLVALVDTRAEPTGDCFGEAHRRGLPLLTGQAVIEARGNKRVNAAWVAPIDSDGEHLTGPARKLACDTLATSGGFSPVVHLACHTGARPVWHDDILGFVPGETRQACRVVGAAAGTYGLAACLREGLAAGAEAARLSGFDSEPPAAPAVTEPVESPPMALYQLPHPEATSRAPKQFVDLQTDVTAADIELATREGFESIEHVKRYTALGFGTDQGKTGNINGMAIVARALGQTIAETGTTVFRPNYTPVSFGAVAGAHRRDLFEPERYTAMHLWHRERGALFENVGQWKRPWYYPQAGETMQQALNRECRAVREGVGILDASTLGKIDIQGPDARDFLGRVYTNAWAKLAPGRCRYGLMCGDDGMVFDDGVTACLGEQHFMMTTTTGGAAGVLEWLELLHQTEWPELDLYFTSVTDHWATMTIAGPHSRALLRELCDDIDLDRDAFKFMDWRTGTVAGVPARVFRISFTGELSFEINVPAHYGLHVWKKLFEHGEQYDLTPYGTETMHILRAEKGLIIPGQDTDGSVHPYDLGMDWAVKEDKPFSFIGKRGMKRADCRREDRKQLVGLATLDPEVVLPEGAHAVTDPDQLPPVPMLGHVTSSYYSANLGRSIALGMIRGGHGRKGETVHYPLGDGRVVAAEIRDPCFLDPHGERQHV